MININININDFMIIMKDLLIQKNCDKLQHYSMQLYLIYFYNFNSLLSFLIKVTSSITKHVY